MEFLSDSLFIEEEISNPLYNKMNKESEDILEFLHKSTKEFSKLFDKSFNSLNKVGTYLKQISLPNKYVWIFIIEALLLMEVDAKEIETDENGVNIYGDPSDLYKIKEAILDYKKDADIVLEDVQMVPNEMVTLSGEDKENFEKLLNMLDDIEDVQKYYHNVNL